jgi:hypothetical protein
MKPNKNKTNTVSQDNVLCDASSNWNNWWKTLEVDLGHLHWAVEMQDEEKESMEWAYSKIKTRLTHERLKTMKEPSIQGMFTDDVLLLLCLGEYNNDIQDAKKILVHKLDEASLDRVDVTDHPSVMMRALKAIHMMKSADAVNLLREELSNLEMEECADMTDYLAKSKKIYSLLRNAGGTMTEREFCLQLTSNLPVSFDMQATLLCAQPNVTFENCEMMLITAARKQAARAKKVKSRRKITSSPQDEDDKYANIVREMKALKVQVANANGNGGGDRRKKVCNECNKPGHTKETCWSLHPEQNPFQKERDRRRRASEKKSRKERKHSLSESSGSE